MIGNGQTDIRIISSWEELEDVQALSIDDFLWHCVRKPLTTCKVAFLKDYGLVLHFRVQESDPKRVYMKPGDPVYLDSAVEFFVCPDPEHSRGYLNLELNANGAYLCQFGEDRASRQVIDALTRERPSVRTRILADEWEAFVGIPNGLFTTVAGVKGLDKGSRITFNLYKICESPEDEHYAAFSHIDSPHPDFHLPQFFAEGTLRQGSDRNGRYLTS